MGKKHFLKLAGLILAGITIAGCQNNNRAPTWQPPPKTTPQQGPSMTQSQNPNQMGQPTQASLTNNQTGNTTPTNPGLRNGQPSFNQNPGITPTAGVPTGLTTPTVMPSSGVGSTGSGPGVTSGLNTPTPQNYNKTTPAGYTGSLPTGAPPPPQSNNTFGSGSNSQTNYSPGAGNPGFSPNTPQGFSTQSQAPVAPVVTPAVNPTMGQPPRAVLGVNAVESWPNQQMVPPPAPSGTGTPMYPPPPPASIN